MGQYKKDTGAKYHWLKWDKWTSNKWRLQRTDHKSNGLKKTNKPRDHNDTKNKTKNHHSLESC